MAALHVPSLMTTSVVVVAAVFPVLSLLSIAIRWKAHMLGVHGWKANDWWILLAWVCLKISR